MPQVMIPGYSLEAETDAAYSAFQECETREGAAIILEVLETPVLRGLCDLSHLSATGTRERLSTRLMLDRWGGW